MLCMIYKLTITIHQKVIWQIFFSQEGEEKQKAIYRTYLNNPTPVHRIGVSNPTTVMIRHCDRTDH